MTSAISKSKILSIEENKMYNLKKYSPLPAILFMAGALLIAGAKDSEKSIELADSLFKAGKFAEAKEAYSKVLAEEPDNYPAVLRLGYIALLGNNLDDAQKWLTRATELKPEEAKPKLLLAEAFYRRDQFQKAAPLLRAVGRETVARKLESFKGVQPYRIEGEANATKLKFVMTDPLPVVQVRVNNSQPVNFLIDTGAAELVIDAEFASEINAVQFGSETGTFAGGKRAGFQQGKIDSLTLGDFTVKNLPVHIINVRRFSQPIFGGKRVDGIIGTVLLYHFISTLDYPEGELILQKRTEDNLTSLEQKAKAEGHIVIPFWMAGDHLMAAWGKVNNSRPMLLFVDTGLAGGGFTCPESTIKEAGIKLQEDKAGEGIGGGGRVKVIPFVVNELALGEAREHNIRGLYAGSPPLGDVFGFHIGGIISHAFFRPYSLTFDFSGMRLFLNRKE
jgi:predicted aspartyl protease